MILVGVGHLGQAILTYDGFQPQGFIIVDAFDADASVVGQKVGGLTVRPISELRELPRGAPGRHRHRRRARRRRRRRSSPTSSPAACAPSSTTPRPPCRCRTDVQIKNIDPVLALQSMTFYLKNGRTARLADAARDSLVACEIVPC